MSDELLYDLRYPPTMSMVVNHDDLYRVMAKRMREAADEIEQARKTAEYWKAEHLAGNAEIGRMREALITIRDKRSQCNRAVDCQQVARATLAGTDTERPRE